MFPTGLSNRSAASIDDPNKNTYRAIMQVLRESAHRTLQEGLSQEQARVRIAEVISQILEDKGIVLPRNERQRLLEAVTNDLVAYGPITALMEDSTVRQINIIGPSKVFIAQGDGFSEADVSFVDMDHLGKIIERLLVSATIDPTSTALVRRAAHPDGTEIIIIYPPAALNGMQVMIRKSLEQSSDLTQSGVLSQPATDLLTRAVRERMTILITGQTEKGIEDLFAFLISRIEDKERVCYLKAGNFLNTARSDAIVLNFQGVEDGQLLRHATELFPDRLLIGILEPAAVPDFLWAINRGYRGSIAAMFAKSPKDALKKIEQAILLRMPHLSLPAVHEHIASGIDFVVHEERLPDGTRRVVQICELSHGRADGVGIRNLFVFKGNQNHMGMIQGNLVSTGVISTRLPAPHAH